jgi:hypothetical protein
MFIAWLESIHVIDCVVTVLLLDYMNWKVEEGTQK